MLGSEHSFLSNLLVEVFRLVNCLLEPLEGGRLREVNPLVAGRAHGKLETNRHGVGIRCGSEDEVLLVPSGLDTTIETVLVEYMFAPQLNDRFLP